MECPLSLPCVYVILISVSAPHLVNNDIGDLSDDPELSLSGENEPEAWSVTVNKKTLKKMSAKDIKRQDHIWGEWTE